MSASNPSFREARPNDLLTTIALASSPAPRRFRTSRKANNICGTVSSPPASPHRRTTMPAFVRFIPVMLLAIAAHATAAQRTFVSTAGNDSNTVANCSLANPCRSFASAITVTDQGGEIIVVDSGGYGPVTIDKTLSITAPPGVYGGISVFGGGTGITINGPSVSVALKGLTINALPTAPAPIVAGIDFQQGARLYLDNCEVTT